MGGGGAPSNMGNPVHYLRVRFGTTRIGFARTSVTKNTLFTPLEILGEQRVRLGGSSDAEPRVRRRDRPHRLVAEAEVDRRARQAARHPRHQRQRQAQIRGERISATRLA